MLAACFISSIYQNALWQNKKGRQQSNADKPYFFQERQLKSTDKMRQGQREYEKGAMVLQQCKRMTKEALWTLRWQVREAGKMLRALGSVTAVKMQIMS